MHATPPSRLFSHGMPPEDFEVGGQAQFLNSLEQAIASQGIDVLRVPV